ncbi:accessory gene regulator ArgB-like protein [Metaclostridioides mangenotii]|uniref:accessory gene regulator ArgB-like protein n=1 Tax=Metaclostridioides mangenotii TaxID=1540 RepID=UPI0026F29027|nr:accessory gene regulator B family protein [Clostridioides mangenotii]
MVELCANKITLYLIENKTIEADDYELYQYAFETIVATIMQLSIIIIIGSSFGRLIETIIFLSFYCPIRQFAGGFHTENYRRCLLFFVVVYTANIFIIDKMISNELTTTMVVIAFVCYVGISFLVPQEHRNVPLNTKEKKKYKKIVICICSILMALSALGINHTITYEYAMFGASVIVWIFIMLILGNIKEGII